MQSHDWIKFFYHMSSIYDSHSVYLLIFIKFRHSRGSIQNCSTALHEAITKFI
ncbi:hypothetical protein PAHAL_2G348500 [Panicum hallii]|uniref:Uncharacterized protein n=1 Tax=Panicum hallii TaxID=206008 RepID=A0A2T8KRG8_9POAL|nr:hypothetical protein PAHAL_2G348500 [Panicum hallii]